MAEATTNPEYISTAAVIMNTLRSTTLGVEGWPADLWLQEQRIAYFQNCFSDAQKLLSAIHDDFHVPNQAQSPEFKPLRIHMEMWQSMYKLLDTLTRPGVLHFVSYLGPEHTPNKTVNYLWPIRDRLMPGLQEAEEQCKEIDDSFKHMLRTGPMVSARTAQSEMYRRWQRSYAVLFDLARALYSALDRICQWILDKMDSITAEILRLTRQKAEIAAARKEARAAKADRQ